MNRALESVFVIPRRGERCSTTQIPKVGILDCFYFIGVEEGVSRSRKDEFRVPLSRDFSASTE